MVAEVRTLGHATLVLSVDGNPRLATDPWLIGSTYWRSWWLEEYPSAEEVELVRSCDLTYLTHSHPDHFHWPSLRMLGPRTTLHPTFPSYTVPGFLRSHDYPALALRPWQRYRLADDVAITSVPVPVDDSILLIETAATLVVDLNDSKPPSSVLGAIRRRFGQNKERVYLLASYSPASSAAAMHRDGERIATKGKAGYVRQVCAFAEALGATHYIPFASQARFHRSDSLWANDLKVTYDDLVAHWPDGRLELCRPYTRIVLDGAPSDRPLSEVAPGALRPAGETVSAKVFEREAAERDFKLPADFDERLLAYLEQVRPLRSVYRHGIGWRLSTSGTERYYNTRTRELDQVIPADWDIVITLPDQVLYDALRNGVLTDLGITMFIRVDTQVDTRRTRIAFILMGLRDYNHLRGPLAFGQFVAFYAAMLTPGVRTALTTRRPKDLPGGSRPSYPAARPAPMAASAAMAAARRAPLASLTMRGMLPGWLKK